MMIIHRPSLGIMALLPILLVTTLSIIWAVPPDAEQANVPSTKITRKELVELRQELNRVSRFATESVTKRKKIEEKIGKAIEMMKNLAIDADTFKDEMAKGNSLNEEVTKSIKDAHVIIQHIYNGADVLVQRIDGFIGEDDVLKGENEAILEVIKEAKEFLNESTPVLDELEKEYDDISAKFKHFVESIEKRGVVLPSDNAPEAKGTVTPEPDVFDEHSRDKSGYTNNELNAMFLGRAPIPTFTWWQLILISRRIGTRVVSKIELLRALKARIRWKYERGNKLFAEFAGIFRNISSLPNGQEMDKFMKLISKFKQTHNVLFEMYPEVIKVASDLEEDLNAHRKKIVECEEDLPKHEDDDIPQNVQDNLVEALKASVVAVEDLESFLPTLRENRDKLIALVGDMKNCLKDAKVLYESLSKKREEELAKRGYSYPHGQDNYHNDDPFFRTHSDDHYDEHRKKNDHYREHNGHNGSSFKNDHNVPPRRDDYSFHNDHHYGFKSEYAGYSHKNDESSFKRNEHSSKWDEPSYKKTEDGDHSYREYGQRGRKEEHRRWSGTDDYRPRKIGRTFRSYKEEDESSFLHSYSVGGVAIIASVVLMGLL